MPERDLFVNCEQRAARFFLSSAVPRTIAVFIDYNRCLPDWKEGETNEGKDHLDEWVGREAERAEHSQLEELTRRE